jgi:hypothetical protein
MNSWPGRHFWKETKQNYHRAAIARGCKQGLDAEMMETVTPEIPLESEYSLPSAAKGSARTRRVCSFIFLSHQACIFYILLPSFTKKLFKDKVLKQRTKS